MTLISTIVLTVVSWLAKIFCWVLCYTGANTRIPQLTPESKIDSKTISKESVNLDDLFHSRMISSVEYIDELDRILMPLIFASHRIFGTQVPEVFRVEYFFDENLRETQWTESFHSIQLR